MAANSGIEWTQSTWNPVTGCTKISPGCRYCYAERMAHRLQAMGQPNYASGFRVTVHEHTLSLPLEWRSPQLVFVNSMSDLFHKHVPVGFVLKVFAAMKEAHWHTYQILTKRSGRLRQLAGSLPWAPQIWMGVSVETPAYLRRVDDLRQTGAHVKFVSFEPLLAPVPDVDLSGIDWVIAGGESGPGARPMRREWIVDIRDQCANASVPFFFKQWGGTRKKRAGRELDGRTHDGMPALASTGQAWRAQWST